MAFIKTLAITIVLATIVIVFSIGTHSSDSKQQTQAKASNEPEQAGSSTTMLTKPEKVSFSIRPQLATSALDAEKANQKQHQN